jgi:hypothetical protein
MFACHSLNNACGHHTCAQHAPSNNACGHHTRAQHAPSHNSNSDHACPDDPWPNNAPAHAAW